MIVRKEQFFEKMQLIQIRNGINPTEESVLIEASLAFYLESFPEAHSGYTRDFGDDEFREALVSPSYVKFYYFNDSGEIVGFAMISDREEDILLGAERDPEFFRKKMPGREEKIFWVFIIAVRDDYRRSIVVPLIAKVLRYILENGGMATFSAELLDVPTLVKQIQSAYRITFGQETESQIISNEVTYAIYLKK